MSKRHMPFVFAAARIVPGIFCVAVATSNSCSRESISKSEGGCRKLSSKQYVFDVVEIASRRPLFSRLVGPRDDYVFVDKNALFF